MSAPKRRVRIVIPPQKRETYDYTSLYLEFWKPVHKQFTYLIKDPWESEDLAQEVFERLIRYWDNIQMDKVTGLLATVATNVLYDFTSGRLNKPNNREYVEAFMDFDMHDEGITDPLRKLVSERAAEAISVISKYFPERDRNIFLSKYTQNLSTKEIAKAHGVKDNYVHVILFNMRKEVIAHLDGLDLAPEERWDYGGN